MMLGLPSFQGVKPAHTIGAGAVPGLNGTISMEDEFISSGLNAPVLLGAGRHLRCKANSPPDLK